MMDIDVRTIFEQWMDRAYRLERDGSFTLAINKYKDALELATNCNDSAKQRAQEGIERCQINIKNKNNEKTF